MKTTLINLRTHRGLIDYVLIDRRTIYGNPFPITKSRDRAMSIRTFRKYFEKRMQVPQYVAAVEELRGKKLACWCTPLACHGNVYIEYFEKGKWW